MLKIKFDSGQEFQQEAVQSITDIFAGQPARPLQFTVTKSRQGQLDGSFNELGYGNKLDLSEEDLLRNVRAVQDRNRLHRSEGSLKDEEYDVPNFAIEMETGTGKTYVYLRTAYELNRQYGFMKFVIVVPSVAIREGVLKTLDITKEHFAGLYPGQRLDYFAYDSSRLNKVKDFATSSAIQIMVINIDAFRKAFEDGDDKNKANVIHKVNDTMEGRRPIEFIQATRPVVIIDEPQSVDNTDKAKEAIKSLTPLCVLRYSATHRKTYNLMYKLGPVDAYERRLVKRIEVAGLVNDGTGPYINLTRVTRKDGSYSANVEINICHPDGVVRPKEVKVNPTKKNDLFKLSNENEAYRDWVISGIDATEGSEYLEFANGEIVRKREAAMDDEIKRGQIKWTIESHLEKEARLFDRGIKVLSLFFIDKVSNYREYTEDGYANGKYAKMFEEEYLKAIASPKYQTLFRSDAAKKYALHADVATAHNGYFSEDKKKQFKDSGEGRSTKDDEGAYELIMKDKERLLSFETNLRFLFSHSALREGWDNPNVFQVCTLVETQDVMTKRQKVGRGLRLPVDQTGERVMDDNINVLTVIANESYESFAENLQMEIECETGSKFEVVTERLFDTIHVVRDGVEQPMGYEAATRLLAHLRSAHLLDRHGRATRELKEAVAAGILELPEEFTAVKQQVMTAIKSVAKRLPVVDTRKRTSVKVNKEVLLGPEFKELWDKIKWKTVYRLDFDAEALVQASIEEIAAMEPIKPNPIVAHFVKIEMTKGGITTTEPHRVRDHVREKFDDNFVPNILEYIERHTGLKRKTLVRILSQSGRLDDCYLNPQKFMEEVIRIINEKKLVRIADNIMYERIGDTEFYAQEKFEADEIIGYLESNALPVGQDRSVYDHIVWQSSIERTFAERLNGDVDVKLFVKLPSWFQVDTPLGGYNPDWAVVLEKNGEKKLYFIVETKGDTYSEELRPKELKKIKCGRRHFAALGTGVLFDVASSYDEWRKDIA